MSEYSDHLVPNALPFAKIKRYMEEKPNRVSWHPKKTPWIGLVRLWNSTSFTHACESVKTRNDLTNLYIQI